MSDLLERLISEKGGGDKTPQKFYGKYRGTVINNIDPMQIGRIQVIVPDVSIIPGSWAMPCVPIAGKQEGIFCIPQIGAGWKYPHRIADS